MAVVEDAGAELIVTCLTPDLLAEVSKVAPPGMLQTHADKLRELAAARGWRLRDTTGVACLQTSGACAAVTTEISASDPDAQLRSSAVRTGLRKLCSGSKLTTSAVYNGMFALDAGKDEDVMEFSAPL